MPQSLACVNIHLVFSTKNRQPSIDDAIMARLHAFMGGIIRAEKCGPLAIGGVADHVHLLVSISREITLAELVRIVKAGSSKWMHQNDRPRFQWQSGYGAFSVSQSNLEVVRNYVLHQEDHHRARSYEDEFRALLRKHGLEFDERYVWD